MAAMTDTPDSGTDQATPDQADTAPEWDYYDPDEDTVEDPANEATDDGTTDEYEDPEEDVDEADEGEGEQEDTDEAEEPAAETFKLANGETVTRDELLSGYLRQSDYTRKTTEVSTRRKAVEAEAQHLSGLFESAVDFFTAMVPDPPDDSLAATNPGQHYAQRVAYENGLRAVKHMRDMAGQTRRSTEAMTNDQRREMAAAENAKLAQAIPETATQQGREKFFGAVSEAAQFYGFTEQEMNSTLDSRIFRMAHDAAQWRRSQAKREKAKVKVQSAPNVPPRPAGKGKPAKNREAMQRLNQSGSIRDAMKVDFD